MEKGLQDWLSFIVVCKIHFEVKNSKLFPQRSQKHLKSTVSAPEATVAQRPGWKNADVLWWLGPNDASGTQSC